MTILFDLRMHVNSRKRYLHVYRTTDPRGNYMGTVRAVEHHGIIGAWFDGKLYTADHEAVRECLPSAWRKAFDRTTVWWWNDQRTEANRTLYTLRGELIGTLFATPYNHAPKKDEPDGPQALLPTG